MYTRASSVTGRPQRGAPPGSRAAHHLGTYCERTLPSAAPGADVFLFFCFGVFVFLCFCSFAVLFFCFFCFFCGFCGFCVFLFFCWSLCFLFFLFCLFVLLFFCFVVLVFFFCFAVFKGRSGLMEVSSTHPELGLSPPFPTFTSPIYRALCRARSDFWCLALN